MLWCPGYIRRTWKIFISRRAHSSAKLLRAESSRDDCRQGFREIRLYTCTGCSGESKCIPPSIGRKILPHTTGSRKESLSFLSRNLIGKSQLNRLTKKYNYVRKTKLPYMLKFVVSYKILITYRRSGRKNNG